MTNFRNVLMSRPLLFPVLLAVAAGSLFIALLFGTFPISVVQVFDSVFFPIPGLVHDVIWRLRLPRALAAFACGGVAPAPRAPPPGAAA